MPRKTERGILGYKKDPKKQILFSFNPRDGDECPSSDSGDSDYLPSEGEDTGALVRRISSTHKRHKPGESTIKSCEVRSVTDNGHILFQGHLPPEIWLRVFHFAVNQYGALPFLVRAAKVCRTWWELSARPSLWQHVDLSYGWIKSSDATLSWLAVNRLSQCRSMSVTSWKNLTSNGLKILSENCPLLKSVNLSYCKKLTSVGVTSLVNNCSSIEELDISFTSNDAVSIACLKHIAEHLGGSLRHLTVGGNMLKSFSTVLSSIMKFCPNLELLDVSNATFSGDFVSFNVEAFQASCTKIKVIRLTNSKFRASSASRRVKDESPGFPHLEQLSLAVSTSGMNSSIGFDDDFVSRLLKTSVDLKLLDLRGCTNQSASCLMNIPATDLVQLHLSQSSVTKYTDLKEVLCKWRHSLTHVDLSWNGNPGNLEEGVAVLTCGVGPSPLENLNIAGTSVRVAPIKSVLNKCLNLTVINLTSCRSLPRGVKREFQGRKKIIQLKKEFESASNSDLESLSD